MKVLMLTTRIPYPPISGAKIVIFNTIKYLAQKGIDITLLAIDSEYTSNFAELTKYCKIRIVTFNTKTKISGLILNIFSRLPYTISKYINKKVIKTLDQILINGKFNIVHIEQLHMTYYGKYLKEKYNLPVIYRAHNLESEIIRRYMKNYRNLFIKAYLYIQWKKMLSYEITMCKNLDVCVMITKEDKQKISTFNHNINAKYIEPGIEIPYLEQPKLKKSTYIILFVGSMSWLPNIEGILWFVNKIYPIVIRNIKNVELVIVGANPTSKIRALNKYRNITVTGFVDNIKRYYQEADVFIVPLKTGSGIRIKILEALSMKTPIVSTTIGAEGIGLTNGVNIMIADDEKNFTESIIKLLKNFEYSKKLSSAGLEFVTKEYSWENRTKEYIQVYNSLLKK